jgi:hypothetical protein
MPAFEVYDPLDPDAAVIGPKWLTRYDESYYEAGARKPGEYYKDLQKAMSQSNYNRNAKDQTAYLRSLYDRMGVSRGEILTNPPTGIDDWDVRVAEFREDHREWQEEAIAQPWPEYALAVYPPWEFPLLEKGRMLMEAIEVYSLDDSEIANVRQEYSSTTAMEGSPLDNLLMGLDGDEEDEYEGDEEDDYDDSTE